MTTDPTAAPQPATPGEALRWAAERITDRLTVSPDIAAHAVAAWLGVWARDLDAAPAADAGPGWYRLPDEPPGPLWDCYGHRWDRITVAMCWERADERDDPYWRGWAWRRLLGEYGPLSTTPPAGTEASGEQQHRN